MKKIDPIVDRLKALFGVRTRVDLAKAMEIGLGTYDNWSARDKIPEKQLRLVSENKGVHLDWLVHGKGEKYKVTHLPDPQFLTPELMETLSKVAEQAPRYGQNKHTKKLCASFDALDDDVKEEVLKEIMPLILKRF